MAGGYRGLLRLWHCYDASLPRLLLFPKSPYATPFGTVDRRAVNNPISHIGAETLDLITLDNKLTMKIFSLEVSNSLRSVMQLVIILSHLYFVLRDVLVFQVANALATSIVAMFLFISGYGLMQGYQRATEQGKDPFVGFMRRRIWGILKPYLVIQALYFALLYWEQSYLPGLDTLWALLRHGHTPLPNAWFIFVLLALYLLFYLVYGILRLRRTQALIAIFAGSIVLRAIPYLLGYERAWWATTLAFFSGLMFGTYEEILYPYLRSWWGILLMIMMVLMLRLQPWELMLPLAFMLIPILILVFLHLSGYNAWLDGMYAEVRTSEGASLRQLQPISGLIASGLMLLATISFELYLIHGIWIRTLRGAMMWVTNDALYLALSLSALYSPLGLYIDC